MSGQKQHIFYLLLLLTMLLKRKMFHHRDFYCIFCENALLVFASNIDRNILYIEKHVQKFTTIRPELNPLTASYGLYRVTPV